MTTSIQHGGVIRAALSLESPEPGEPEVVQLLTSGTPPPLRLPFVQLSNAFMMPPCTRQADKYVWCYHPQPYLSA